MRHTFDEILAAFQFLTRLPVPSPRYSDDLIGRAAAYFPVVGAVIGFAAGGLNLLLFRHVGPWFRATLVLAMLVVVTGGFHEDGLADTADGLGGGYTREKTLQIMRDSRIGSFGTIALCLSLLARFALIGDLPYSTSLRYLVSAHVLARWTALPLAYFLPSARAADGQGGRLIASLRLRSVLVGTVLALGIAVLVLRSSSVLPILCVSVLVLLAGRYFRAQIGGVTGDCLGTVNQLTEILVYSLGCIH